MQGKLTSWLWRWIHPPPIPVDIQGMNIEMVKSYKYMGAHLNNKLYWTDNPNGLYEKEQSRLYLLRRLGCFGVQGALLRTFVDSLVASSATVYWVVCWGSSIISTTDRKRLNRLVKKGCPPRPSGGGGVGEWWISYHLWWWTRPTPCRSFLPAAVRFYSQCCSR